MSAPAHIARENGKKGGRPKGSKSKSTMLAEAGKSDLIRSYLENIRPINDALIGKAMEGDISAIREIHDRIHGRAHQSVEVSGSMETKVINLNE